VSPNDYFWGFDSLYHSEQFVSTFVGVEKNTTFFLLLSHSWGREVNYSLGDFHNGSEQKLWSFFVCVYRIIAQNYSVLAAATTGAAHPACARAGAATWAA